MRLQNPITTSVISSVGSYRGLLQPLVLGRTSQRVISDWSLSFPPCDFSAKTIGIISQRYPSVDTVVEHQGEGIGRVSLADY